MNKHEFLAQLRKGLYGLSQNDIEERLTFYSEMIEDKKEEGITEEAAVESIGSVDEIISQIKADSPVTKNYQRNNQSKKRLSIFEIVLLVLGSPIWISISIAALAVILSFYVSLWAIIISFWAVFASLLACFISAVPTCIIFVIYGHTASGFVMLAAGLVCAGLSIFTFYGCKAATKGILILTNKVTLWIKNRIMKKEEA